MLFIFMGLELVDVPYPCVIATTVSPLIIFYHISRGGFPIIRHNEVRDITSLLTKVCTNVTLEPNLTGEGLNSISACTEPNARLSIAAQWYVGGHFKKTFFYVHVFNPFSKSNSSAPLPEDLSTTRERKEEEV